MAWDDGTLQWQARLVDDTQLAGFLNQLEPARTKGAQPQDRQLLVMEPMPKNYLDAGATVGITRGTVVVTLYSALR